MSADFIFISMPYARFISRWFSNIPNINLGIMQSLLTQNGKSVKTFHFHLEFLPLLKTVDPQSWENFLGKTEQFGVEYMGLDYVFASLLFRDEYERSRQNFSERLESMGLALNDFETMRRLAGVFIESAFSKLSPHLKDTKLVGFSCSHYQLSSSLLLCTKIRKAYPHIPTVFGGKDCSGSFAYELMKNAEYVDFVGANECEVTVESLLEHLEDGEKEIYNVAYRDGDGTIRQSKSKPNISLNSLPFPGYDLQEFPVKPDEIILPLELGRGCPWKRCTFCPDESYHIHCQTKTAERVKDEIEYYQHISNDLRNFFILDSDALKDQNLITGLAEYLDGKGFIFHYAEFRAERMNREVLRSLLRFGAWASHFQIGIETFSERLLRLMNKGVTALKNVEVVKSVAELGVPIQFNLFTCYPAMTVEDMHENNRIMDLITHLLVSENIQIWPGEFYLPTDCPVFLESDSFRIKKYTESIFSYLFERFPMPSYSNYPYPYQFDNEEEQYNISEQIRAKVQEIKGKNPSGNFMVYERSSNGGLEIIRCRDWVKTSFPLNDTEAKVYLSAVEEIQQTNKVSESFNLPVDNIISILDDFEKRGLILYSSDRKSFLSLATKAFG